MATKPRMPYFVPRARSVLATALLSVYTAVFMPAGGNHMTGWPTPTRWWSSSAATCTWMVAKSLARGSTVARLGSCPGGTESVLTGVLGPLAGLAVSRQLPSRNVSSRATGQ